MEEKGVKKAVALQYDHKGKTPMVTAKGRGLVAHRIIERASELGVPLVQAPKEVDELSEVSLDSYIPPELYGAVAEIYAFLMDVDEKLEKI